MIPVGKSCGSVQTSVHSRAERSVLLLLRNLDGLERASFGHVGAYVIDQMVSHALGQVLAHYVSSREAFIFDLVNIHLFHDASNLIAVETWPSAYSNYRHRALEHTLKRISEDKHEKVPHFIFGDFNFRLDTQSVVKSLCATAKEERIGNDGQIKRLVYKEEGSENGKVVLTLEKKVFDHFNQEVFINDFKWLHQFDKEPKRFADRLQELDITFPPSYPFSEDVREGRQYMKTRCPAWCDRILLSQSARDLIQRGDEYSPVYHVMGSNVCMGDHKKTVTPDNRVLQFRK
ncbi:Type I inositol 1,4,5-trisphosphate 5-phosphatase, partial [Branchiostoma belcheri]